MQHLVIATMVIITCWLPHLAQGQEKNRAASEWPHGRLQITANGHFLSYADGTPFFWLGDTAWELFNRLTKEEIGRYLDNRKGKGYNVIQAVALANTDKPLAANQYGDMPLKANRPDRPNDRYFELVDWTVQQALERGMFIGLLPTWGDRVLKLWSTGEELFDTRNAYQYGLFLGRRYKDYPNIIWITGGDRPALTDSIDKRPIWEAMIRGIRKGAGNEALVTYHPWGEHSTTQFWENNSPLDFNMIQSGHARHDVPVWEWVVRDYHATPTKPVLDSEPTYEDHPVNWDIANGYFRAYDVRKQLYRSVFSGACGVTYGHQAVWQFYSPRVAKIVDPDRYWTEALDRPGAFQAGYLKALILSRPSLTRVPDQTLLLNPKQAPPSYPTAFRDEECRYLMAYLPEGGPIAIKGTAIPAESLTIWWFDPQTGSAQHAGTAPNSDSLTFSSPSSGHGHDWVLIVEDTKLGYGAPGQHETKTSNYIKTPSS